MQRCSAIVREKFALTEPWLLSRATQRRTFYADYADDIRVSDRVADYATPGEASAAIQALTTCWRELGKKLNRAKRQAGALCRQPGEGKRVYTQRWLAMPEAEQALALAVLDVQDDRRQLNQVARELRAGVLSWRGRAGLVASLPAFTLLIERWDAALAKALDAARQRVEATPIDDAAWQRELHRREDIDTHGAVRILRRVAVR